MIIPVVVPAHHEINQQVQVLPMRNFALGKMIPQSSLTPIDKKQRVTVHFNKGVVGLNHQQKWHLNQLNFNQSYTVTGYSSKRGSKKISQLVDLRRAQAVASYLVSMKVSVCKITSQGEIAAKNPNQAQNIVVRSAKC